MGFISTKWRPNPWPSELKQAEIHLKERPGRGVSDPIQKKALEEQLQVQKKDLEEELRIQKELQVQNEYSSSTLY